MFHTLSFEASIDGRVGTSQSREKRAWTVPGVGSNTALTWALEIGYLTRFTSIKQAIGYCALCGDEKSSADKIMRMPIFNLYVKVIGSKKVDQLTRQPGTFIFPAWSPDGSTIWWGVSGEQSGTGTVRTCPPLPTRSTMAQ